MWIPNSDADGSSSACERLPMIVVTLFAVACSVLSMWFGPKILKTRRQRGAVTG